MVLPFSQFFYGTLGNTNKNRPLLNDIPTATIAGTSHIGGFTSNSLDPYKFWKRFKNNPELISTISIPITDIMGDRPEWTAPDGEALGRNKRIEAEEFWRNNRGKETIKAMLYDAFFSGDGYIWKGNPNEKEIKEAFQRTLEKFNIKEVLDTKETKKLLIKSIQDEDLKKLKRFDYVAASTMKILNDEYDIIGYQQTANGKQIKFNPKDIIHYRYMTVNGMVNGFTPVEALFAEIYLLTLVKQNMISFMENGGSPDKVFILDKEIANSKNHKFLVETLKKYKNIKNAHGNLVFTGNLKIEDLQGNPKDLEYKDLALYITSNIAFAFGIPVSRIPYLIGSSAATDSGGGAESGYWNRISDLQDSIEDLLNSQLFGPLGWHIKFPRKYKQDAVREAQTNSMNADTIIKYHQILEGHGLKMSEKKMLELLGWNIEDIEEAKDLLMEETMNNMNNQNMLPNSQVMEEPGKQNRDNQKRNSANQKDKVAQQNP